MKWAAALLAVVGQVTVVAQAGRVEDIYIARSIRESRVTPTDFSTQARTGFGSQIYEDRFTMQSTATRASDGLMTDDNVNTIGRLRTCNGTTPDSKTTNFYAEGVFGAMTFTGSGQCLTVRPDYPEPGLEVARCFLDLRDVSGGYIGGLLTTNTMRSRQLIGVITDPPGYTQNSIATIRLWKRR
jgi:hypothetical protein